MTLKEKLKAEFSINCGVATQEDDPALQIARIKWGYVMTALFICMLISALPAGKLIDKAGRKSL
ncbi:MAG: hypothetical protein QW493_03790 [Candidatus Bathyarchaeia archaeon]